MKKNAGVKDIALATVIMLLSALTISAVTAMLVGKQVLPEHMGGLMAVAVTEAVMGLLCYIHARKAQKGKLTAAILLAVPFFAVRLLSGVVFSTGEGMGFRRCLLSVGVVVVAGLLGSGKQKRRR